MAEKNDDAGKLSGNTIIGKHAGVEGKTLDASCPCCKHAMHHVDESSRPIEIGFVECILCGFTTHESSLEDPKGLQRLATAYQISLERLVSNGRLAWGKLQKMAG